MLTFEVSLLTCLNQMLPSLNWGVSEVYMQRRLNVDCISSRAGWSPTFQDPGTPLIGLAGTRVPASPIEQLLSFLKESFDLDSDSRVSRKTRG